MKNDGGTAVQVTIDDGKILLALRECASKDLTRPSINCICIQKNGEGAVAVATDGHILLKMELNEDAISGEVPEGGLLIPVALLPTKPSRFCVRIIGMGNGEVRVIPEGGEVTKVGRPMGGAYVDWERVMGEKFKNGAQPKIIINPVVMMKLLKVCKYLGSESLHVEFSEDGEAPYRVEFKGRKGVTAIYMPMAERRGKK